VTRPRILLCPQFTEVEWVIAPELEDWAEVATFDAPGVGDEPMPGGDIRKLTREVIVDRGLEEVDERGWDWFFVAGDALGTATAVRLARRRPESIVGLALGHASLSYETEGERAAINGEVQAAMGQLLRNDYESFVRYGITQMTQGTFDEEVAQRMIDRFPAMDIAAAVWDAIHELDEPVGEMLRELDKPLLLAEHDRCIVHTAEGFQDAVKAFPQARAVTCELGPSTDPAFVAALKDFCDDVLAAA
jgi:pimeloyl-ACP methyl ester carboxylesterase